MGHQPSFTEYVYSPVKYLGLPPDSIICFMSNHIKLQVCPGLHLPQLQIQLTVVYKPRMMPQFITEAVCGRKCHFILHLYHN